MIVRKLEGISVVLPALNEAGNVRAAVERTRAAAHRFAERVEVIVVDDGSTDATRAEGLEAGARVVSHNTNRGYGAALRSGFTVAREPWIFQMDCDNQFDPVELQKLVQLADRADIVIGMRSERADHWRRIWAGRLWNLLCRMAFGRIVRDVDCGFKLISRSAVNVSDLQCNGAGISLEMCVSARAAGFRIAEVPVRHQPRTIGAQTGLRPHVVARGLWELYRLKRRYRKGTSPAPVGAAAMGPKP